MPMSSDSSDQDDSSSDEELLVSIKPLPSIDVDDQQLWLIRLPSNLKLSDLHGQRLPSNLLEQPVNPHIQLLAKSGELKSFARNLQILREAPQDTKDEEDATPAVPRRQAYAPVPQKANLKRRWTPIGGGTVPKITGTIKRKADEMDTTTPKSEKKKKKHKSDKKKKNKKQKA